jgi:hypothetical protein
MALSGMLGPKFTIWRESRGPNSSTEGNSAVLGPVNCSSSSLEEVTMGSSGAFNLSGGRPREE